MRKKRSVLQSVVMPEHKFKVFAEEYDQLTPCFQNLVHLLLILQRVHCEHRSTMGESDEVAAAS
jgi:hypothetical protein